MIISIIIISGLVVIFTLVGWIVHISQTKDFTSAYGWGTLKAFKREYRKYDWEPAFNSSHTFFLGVRSGMHRESSSELHASIIAFQGKGMLLDPITLILAALYMKKFEEKVDKEKVVWR